MKPELNVPHSRREFFRTCARGLGLAGLGLVGGVLAARRAERVGAESCENSGVCRGCPAYSGCGLPQALSARQRGMRE